MLKISAIGPWDNHYCGLTPWRVQGRGLAVSRLRYRFIMLFFSRSKKINLRARRYQENFARSRGGSPALNELIDSDPRIPARSALDLLAKHRSINEIDSSYRLCRMIRRCVSAYTLTGQVRRRLVGRLVDKWRDSWQVGVQSGALMSSGSLASLKNIPPILSVPRQHEVVESIQ